MATELIDLKDYIVTDKGGVIYKLHFYLSRLRHLLPICNLPVYPSDIIENNDVLLHNRSRPDDKIIIWQPGIKELPDTSTYEYDIPDEYLSINLEKYIIQIFVDKFPDKINEVYLERIFRELGMIEDRNMEEFLYSIIYLIDLFKKNNVIYGIGRGSCCASLLLYIIGAHFVDPVEYDIPIEEFLR